MEKAFEIQRQVRDNVKTFQTYLTDLDNWEAEMKRKEAALNGAFEQDLPPVRSKLKREKPVVVKKSPEKRISSFDYKAWDQFDADKACEDIDMAEVGPVSLDGKKSQQVKQDKLREEAQYEKERGNTYVKKEKWDEAIQCYTRAIELVKDDAIYFANRGLCYLKKDSLHQAEKDCTEALRLDPTYVKAFQRRATARERLGSLRAASRDLMEVIKLEPHNHAAKQQLETIKTRMGTKGSKSKSSPSSTPTAESKPIITPAKAIPKIIELPDEPTMPAQKKIPTKPTQNVPVMPAQNVPVMPVQNSAPAMPAQKSPLVMPVKPVQSSEDKWKDGVDEGITVIKPVKKPPHLRSKRALKPVSIQEILLGKSSPEKPPTRLKIVELEDELAHGDSNNNEAKIEKEKESRTTGEKGKGDMKEKILTPESVKLIEDATVTEKLLQNLVPPTNSVQFMAEWKYLKGKGDARTQYLSIIDPHRIPSIFENALESDVLSDVLTTLHSDMAKFGAKTVAAYLQSMTKVKRFSALAMFLSDGDKKVLNDLLHHCKTVEKLSDDAIADLKNKYEI
ncbi:RNA polymerase II-associated protein 3-like isoform X3 [Ostrinia furnacalis]|uniref:RNA polymerase II-associated protein 3-like isoform X1 n=3 Tax=Ostrinia furnacalis TaxID=93504 RepID=UPI00103B80C1|nr:RNA polymerase II-associated protein 3-like isoform X1 [Ostrinia furnacalis]XP_028179249.1 RNA polymerase II-associated protein 3-like isoform X2 [Ostrinia furnacalis]XP_028179250.1 RNA polymerase II-associated protein 3-like isoform X3 [Ostrinia furnacalis]